METLHSMLEKQGLSPDEADLAIRKLRDAALDGRDVENILLNRYGIDPHFADEVYTWAL